MILAAIILLIIAVGLGFILYSMDGWISFLTVFLCSLITVCVVYGVVNLASFIMAFICSSIIMVIIWAVIECIKDDKQDDKNNKNSQNL